MFSRIEKAGKPKAGPIFENKCIAHKKYKKSVNESKNKSLNQVCATLTKNLTNYNKTISGNAKMNFSNRIKLLAISMLMA